MHAWLERNLLDTPIYLLLTIIIIDGCAVVGIVAGSSLFGAYPRPKSNRRRYVMDKVTACMHAWCGGLVKVQGMVCGSCQMVRITCSCFTFHIQVIHLTESLSSSQHDH